MTAKINTSNAQKAQSSIFYIEKCCLMLHLHHL